MLASSFHNKLVTYFRIDKFNNLVGHPRARCWRYSATDRRVFAANTLAIRNLHRTIAALDWLSLWDEMGGA